MDANAHFGHPDILMLTRMLERANQIASTTNLDTMLAQMLALSIEISGAQAGICYLIAQEAPLVARAAQGLPSGRAVIGSRLVREDLLACQCMLTGKSVSRELRQPEMELWLDMQYLYGMELKNTLVIPIPRQVYPTGVVQLFNVDLRFREILQMLYDRLATDIQKLLLLDTSEERTRRLQSMIGFWGRIDSSTDPHQILETLIEDASKLLNAEVSSLFLTDDITQENTLVVSSCERHRKQEPLRIPKSQGIIGHVIDTGEAVIVNDTKRDLRHYRDVDIATGFNTHSLVAVPLLSRPIHLANGHRVASERIIGGLEAVNKLNGEFDAVDLSLLESLANQAATVLQISNLYKEADELFVDAVQALTAAIDAKDPYTRGHSQRVSDISVAIANEMGMDRDSIHHIRIGSMLHDVGKIGVSDAILLKPGSLTQEEYTEVKQHPLVGERMLRRVRTLRSELAAITEHHERLDGSGYPRGLKGDEISIIGRIVAVADAFDAMTSNRPYRAALSFEEAVLRLLGARDQYDQRCVNALIAVYQMPSLQELLEINRSAQSDKISLPRPRLTAD